MHARSHWANFYAHHREPEPGSSFAEAIQARPDTPETIVDLGCGNGRDSLFFLAAGHRVVGIDAADSAIAAAREHAAASPAADRADFRVVDVSDAEALRATLADVVAGADGEPIMCYLRFFLHAITEEIQGKLLVAIDETARAGDLFAAEFRTTEDKERAKSHGRHFRRYQDGPAFGALLRDRYRYTLLDETEGTGIAPWGDEDPYLYRVIARHG
jgi:SAM-dependent methyltransferase